MTDETGAATTNNTLANRVRRGVSQFGWAPEPPMEAPTIAEIARRANQVEGWSA